MNKVVCLYALSGLFAGAIFSSCIFETPRNYKAKNDSNIFETFGEFILLEYPSIVHLSHIIN